MNEISKLNVNGLVVNLKDKHAREDIEALAKNIYISDEDFDEIFNDIEKNKEEVK